MIKVCIVTIVSYNFGNRLQNYALQETIKSLGCNVKTLGRGKVPSSKEYFILTLKRFVQKIIGTKGECFNKFNKKIKMSRFYADTERYPDCLHKYYDFFIAGSDQVWNPYYSFVGSADMLAFARPEQKISYAASFGVSDIPQSKRVLYTKLLKDFKMLSVREKEGARIIRNLTGREAEVLIDPTMMLNADEWRRVSKKSCGRKKNEKYILKYFLGKQANENTDYIKTIAEKKCYGIYELMDKSQPKIYKSGPAEFIDLIDHAELVCTDSFHACVFSILFDKPFLVFDRDGNGAGMGSRISTLLFTLGLERKMPGCVDEDNIFEHDYTNAYRRLEKERKKALDFLKRSLRLEDED